MLLPWLGLVSSLLVGWAALSGNEMPLKIQLSPEKTIQIKERAEWLQRFWEEKFAEQTQPQMPPKYSREWLQRLYGRIREIHTPQYEMKTQLEPKKTDVDPAT